MQFVSEFAMVLNEFTKVSRVVLAATCDNLCKFNMLNFCAEV